MLQLCKPWWHSSKAFGCSLAALFIGSTSWLWFVALVVLVVAIDVPVVGVIVTVVVIVVVDVAAGVSLLFLSSLAF